LDVQFCTEVTEASQALDGRRHTRDEIEDEQREKELKNRLNKEFQSFCTKVEELSKIEFDSPYNDLGFNGVPFRTNVMLVPTVHCLVSLSEPPFFCITLNEVEIAHFERVQFSLKNFDLVFVFKDYSKPVIHINSIQVQYLDQIKEWLDGCDIKFYEGPQNLNWTQIMSIIRKDPEKFHTRDGGWTFLSLESDSEERVSDEESAFTPEEVEEASDSDSFSSEDDDDSDADSDGSSDDESDFEEEDEDSDEQDRKAKEEDKRRVEKKEKEGIFRCFK